MYRVALHVVLLAGAAVIAACGTDEPALARGDRLWADSEYTAALAEYRLALRQHDDEETLARVAHAYIVTGAFERAREHYDRLLAEAPDYTDQAIFDYVTAARRARDRSNRYGMAVAVEAALALRPGLPVDEMAAPLARYYASTGDADRALNFFEHALSHAPPDSASDLLYEIGELHVGRGNCVEAVGFFNAYRQRTPDGDHATQARWHVGNCAFQLGRQARQRNELPEAVRQMDILLDLGVPQNLLDQAWFERGEALLALDRRDEALQSFLQVLEVNRTRSGQLVERAQQRIDQIRFGRTFVP
jgi:tetratricopeptide (TPR) repeat protein